jgi:hypothetical protein
MGTVFIGEGLGYGQASIHFFDQVEGVNASGSYISYENAPESWKRLDGSAPPVLKYFEDQQFDKDARTFKGKIKWGNNTFFGAKKQKFVIKFTPDFKEIQYENENVQVLK